LLLSDGGRVTASTYGLGDSGNVTINASSLVQLTGFSPTKDQLPSAILAQANNGSTGNGGNLTITTGRLIVRDGGQVSAATFGAGLGGVLDVRASDSIEVSGTSPNRQFTSGLYSESRSTGNSTGKAGDVTISTPVLLLSDGGVVKASTFGSGQAGNITVNASSLVQMIGSSADGQLSVIYALAEGGSTGKAGDVTIK